MKLRSLAQWLVQRVLASDRAEALLGDLEEERDHLGDRRYFVEALIAVVLYIGEFFGRRIVTVRSVTLQVLRHAAAFAGFWLTAFVVMRLTQHALPGWRPAELAMLTSCVLGVLLSLRLRAHLVTFFLAGQVAFVVSEFAMHSTYGIRTVQGRQTHFAVMIAATLGVVLGAVLIRFISRRPSATAAAAAS